MSKLLKLIVNVFLVAAILIAVAILVPPLAGVKTTIVDTTAMKTNLPLGSVTYSNDIDVFDIKPGDVILKENDSSTYAYVIIETDAANGKFKAISAADPNGPEEEVILRNTVSKVAVMVPYIGFILIAMHSLEGIIIIILVVILLVIMFILSELWKDRGEDEDEEQEEGEEEKEPVPQVTATEEIGIDTEMVRAAFEENHSAVEAEDGQRGDTNNVSADGAEGLQNGDPNGVPADGTEGLQSSDPNGVPAGGAEGMPNGVPADGTDTLQRGDTINVSADGTEGLQNGVTNDASAGGAEGMQNSDPNGVPADGTAAMQDSDTNDTPADETEKQGSMSWSERRAARKARKKAEKEARAAAEQEGLAGAGAVAAGVAGAAAVGMASGTESEDSAPGAPDYSEALPESDLADDLKIEEALAEFGIAPAKEEREITADFRSFSDETVNVPEKPDLSGVQDVPYDRSAAESLPGNDRYPLDAGSGLADLADKMEARSGGSDYYMEDIPYSSDRETAVVPEEDITPAAPPAAPSVAESAAGQRFVPTSRPTYEEIMDETRGTSGQPSVRKDDKSGVSVVDMSDLL